MKQFLILLSILFVVGAFSPAFIHAKRKLPTASTTKSAAVKKPTSGARGITTSVKFRGDRRAIIATFSNLDIASSVSYTLTYTSRGIQEGAGGSLSDLSGIQTRELLFATCSAGICRYHTGIKNARLTVTTTLKDGRKVSKVFRLKV